MKTKSIAATAANITITKSLKSKLISAVHKVLKDNKAELTGKIERAINKSIKKIVKKTDTKTAKAIVAT